MRILFLMILVFSASNLFAQFTSQGKINFERKTNIKLMYQTEEGHEWIKDYIDKVAQFKISLFSLTFEKNRTTYLFEKDEEVTKGYTYTWGKEPAHENMVLTDFNSKKITAQKDVYEKTFLVEMEQPSYKWKIAEETREIAGYRCRKATTIICDSVVVVAFYTDQLMVSGGPESFNGLPGMILGLAIPRLYTTWFATSVEIIPQEVSAFKPARKAKKVSDEEFNAEIAKMVETWSGLYRNKLLWWLTL